jgi:outer membrane protein TolC
MPEAYSTTGHSGTAGKWWHSFEDSALNILIEEGLARNFSIRSAWDRLRQAEQACGQGGSGFASGSEL